MPIYIPLVFRGHRSETLGQNGSIHKCIVSRDQKSFYTFLKEHDHFDQRVKENFVGESVTSILVNCRTKYRFVPKLSSASFIITVRLI